MPMIIAIRYHPIVFLFSYPVTVFIHKNPSLLKYLKAFEAPRLYVIDSCYFLKQNLKTSISTESGTVAIKAILTGLTPMAIFQILLLYAIGLPAYV